MKTSESINEIAAALAVAQGQFTNPPRNRSVKVTMREGKGQYDFTYATLDCIMDTIRAPLASNGLCLTHSLDADDHGTLCTTRLTHSTGQFMETWIPVLVAESANAQGWGSAITYARRYGVVTLLAIAADEDDDGNAGCGNEAEPVTRQTRPAKKPPETNGTNGKRSSGTAVSNIDAPDVRAALDYAVSAPDWEHCISAENRVNEKSWTKAIKDTVVTALWERRLRLVKDATAEQFRNGLPELISAVPANHAYKQRIDEAAGNRMAELDAVVA